MLATEKPRWVSTVHFLLLLGIIITLIISWFNLSSYLTLLLLLGVLINNKQKNSFRSAFTNRLFLAYLALCLVECAGLLYTDNLISGWKSFESKASLVAMPFILCAGSFGEKDGYRKLMTAYTLILFLITVICLGVAIARFTKTGNIEVFFYHELVDVLAQNAIVFSIFMLGGLLFLISHHLYPAFIPLKKPNVLRNFLIVWFFVFITLLASKLLLVVLALTMLRFFFKRFSGGRSKVALVISTVLLAATVVLFVTTDNPIKKRYDDIFNGDMSILRQDKFSPDMYFNGVQYRLLVWRFSLEILNDHKAWVLGVSPGNSQDLLNQKYIDANMYIGTVDKKDVGFLYYDAHNQYMQQLLQSGILGLVVFLLTCFLLVRQAIRQGTMEAAFMTLTLLAVFFTASLLELQHGLFLFTFFPFLYPYNPNNQHTMMPA